MNGSSFNTSFFPTYFWSDCHPYDGESGGPSAGLVVLLVTDVVEFVAGLPSNLWLAWFILQRRSKADGILTADLFPFSLALVKVPFYVMVPVILANHLLWRNAWIMATTTFFSSSLITLKPLLMCLVCVERYLAVVRPLDFLRFKAFKYKWRALVLLFCLNICLGVFAAFYNSIVALCMIFLPVLAVDTYCCVAVLNALRKSPPGDRQEVGNEKKGDVAGNREMHGKKRKAVITILLVQVTLMVNYVPLIVTAPIQGLVPARVFKCQYMAMALAAALGCGYLYPLFYLYNNMRHQKNTKSKI
ncbi:uncharacterized protein LOC109511876 [Hippocampus comes]|uniref:uncharacterized protein LOC109511876 n=1 Tax=Hippocampus comes TaxID=109280 RepID=UPI00094F2517|nr:PREDICTED: uncharacterized protein LOC109511876 [Hippocampus comes]